MTSILILVHLALNKGGMRHMLNYVEMLKLESHEEGGYFGLYYQSPNKVMPLSSRYKNDATEQRIERHAGSSIYFLLEKQGFSAWHRLKSDEIWHYYDGSPIDIHIIDQYGNLNTHILGNPSMTKGASFQVVIQANDWVAAEVKDKLSFGLIGRTTSPGLKYGDFELADRKILLFQFPQHENIINRFTRITPTHSKSWPSKTTMIGYATVALVASLGLYSLFKENVISDIYVDDLKSRLQM